VISDAEVERCIRQLRAAQPFPESAPSANGNKVTGAKGLDAVTAEAYEWMRKVLSDVTNKSYVHMHEP
jgi:hypothetical protein